MISDLRVCKFVYVCATTCIGISWYIYICFNCIGRYTAKIRYKLLPTMAGLLKISILAEAKEERRMNRGHAGAEPAMYGELAPNGVTQMKC